jgi:hypothetical protein
MHNQQLRHVLMLLAVTLLLAMCAHPVTAQRRAWVPGSVVLGGLVDALHSGPTAAQLRQQQTASGWDTPPPPSASPAGGDNSGPLMSWLKASLEAGLSALDSASTGQSQIDAIPGSPNDRQTPPLAGTSPRDVPLGAAASGNVPVAQLVGTDSQVPARNLVRPIPGLGATTEQASAKQFGDPSQGAALPGDGARPLSDAADAGGLGAPGWEDGIAPVTPVNPGSAFRSAAVPTTVLDAEDANNSLASRTSDLGRLVREWKGTAGPTAGSAALLPVQEVQQSDVDTLMVTSDMLPSNASSLMVSQAQQGDGPRVWSQMATTSDPTAPIDAATPQTQLSQG